MSNKKYFLSLAAIVKNEDSYLEEWIAFHKAVGVEHFYLYDNNSTIPVSQTLKNINQDLITIINFPGRSMQMVSYNHCLKNFGHQSQWIGFLDLDELAFPTQELYLTEVLKKYSSYGGLVANWRIFGSNGHLNKPSGLLIDNYTKSTPASHEQNRHIKSFVQPEFVNSAGSNPHYFLYKKPYFAVNENFKTISNAFSDYSANHILINHYYNKSLQEFKQRASLGRADDFRLEGRKLDYFHQYDQASTEENHFILRFREHTIFNLENK